MFTKKFLEDTAERVLITMAEAFIDVWGVDRVSALGGTLSIGSPEGEGTVLRAELPCGS